MSQTGTVYAQALYSLAKEEGCCQSILDQLSVLGESISAEPAFLRLLSAPNLPKAERCGILDESFRDKVHPYVLNFMKLLTEKGEIRQFPDCCKAYRKIYNRENGILEVVAVTAIDLDDSQKDKLIGKLTQVTGKTVELTHRIDPACMGGIRLDYDGKCVDDTVQHRLQSIAKLLKNTVL